MLWIDTFRGLFHLGYIRHWGPSSPRLREFYRSILCASSSVSANSHGFPGHGHRAGTSVSSAVLLPGSHRDPHLVCSPCQLVLEDFPMLIINRHIVTLVLRLCIKMRYHRKLSSSPDVPELDPYTIELRKRFFWCAYCFDRSCSILTKLPFGISDSDIDVEVRIPGFSDRWHADDARLRLI